jgi:hypothetical protein
MDGPSSIVVAVERLEYRRDSRVSRTYRRRGRRNPGGLAEHQGEESLKIQFRSSGHLMLTEVTVDVADS